MCMSDCHANGVGVCPQYPHPLSRSCNLADHRIIGPETAHSEHLAWGQPLSLQLNTEAVNDVDL